MGDIFISILTIGIICYLFYLIVRNRQFIFRYITSTGGTAPLELYFSKASAFVFISLNVVIAIISFICLMTYEFSWNNPVYIFTGIMMSLIFILILWFLTFMIIICIREIRFMKDRIITTIILCSIVFFAILLLQILNGDIDYPEAFIVYSSILFIMNIVSIGRIISIILRKKVSVKSIWFISIINISFVILALTNIAYQLKPVYGTSVYSRDLVSWGDALYFVVITFFTVGYGDLYPICEVSKILSMVIIISGFIFTAIFISAALSVTYEHFSRLSENK